MIKFGTGGWRAIIADGFTKENVQLLAAALVQKMPAEGEKGVVIGFDRRFLSDIASQWAAEVFAAYGIPVRLIAKAAPTPLIMFEVKRTGLPFGIAVTASHNPAVYNGVKIFTAGGRDADEAFTKELEGCIERVGEVKSIPYADGLAAGLIEEINPQNLYLDSILSVIDERAIRSAGLNVALDPMFGVSRTSLQTILMTARCNVDVIHERRDTLFGGRLPAPNVKTLGALQDYVVENGCNIGIATDGDADRLGVIDETGRFLHPNEILVLLYYYLLKYKGWKGSVVRNLVTTHLLDRVAALFGEDCHEVPVGFKHISSKMAETGAIIGGESSGGLTVKGHIPGKDGIYAAALLVEMIAVTGRRLSETWAEIAAQTGTLYAAEADFRFSEEKKEEILSLIMRDKQLPAFPLKTVSVSYLDGCKVLFENGGWLSVRFSGTEPLLRLSGETDDPALSENLCALMRSFIGM
ncbi:MAG: phosphoglucomutase/phosphomannomutase family protein [Oscillospiraceae bacterium]|jgi:phosphomannomutase|nr:phosphoglucomutase/phosphomannomutase family protein [Oscillospiraceae bacterium]